MDPVVNEAEAKVMPAITRGCCLGEQERIIKS